MARKRIKMRKLKELFRLKFENRLSNRQIANSCNTSHSIVGKYLFRFKESGLSWPLAKDMNEDELHQRLFADKGRIISSESRPLPDWQQIYKELKSNKSVTLQLLWSEYSESNPEGYCYSHFCHKYNQWKRLLNTTMRQNHKAGEKLFVDYAGQTVDIISPITGEVCSASIFVAVLGASNYTYAEGQLKKDSQNWISGHVRAFEYFGGVTEIVVPDNLKVGVKSPCFYDPVINPVYQDLADHYGVTVIPARIRKPKDKAKVEVGIKVVKQTILATLRKRKFFSIGQLNQAIHEILQELNNREMKHLKKSRKQLFETLDKPNLKPLPQKPYEYCDCKSPTVGIDYHVRYDHNYYSVPYRLVHEKVEVRVTEKLIEIFYKNQPLTTHLRSYDKNQYITKKEHMPPNHQYMLEWTPKRFINWARKIGTSTTELIFQILESKDHPQQSFRKCIGILKLTDRYSDEQLEAACKRALHYQISSYKKIKNILKKGFEKIPVKQYPDAQIQPNLLHKNIRGDQYYKKEVN